MVAVTESGKKINIWLHSLCPETFAIEDFGTCFHDTPIHTEPYRPENHSQPGVVLAAEINSQLYDFVRMVSKDRDEHVVVILTDPGALANGNPWQVLQAGASDIFAWDRALDLAPALTAKFQRWQEVDDLIQSPLIRNGLIGHSRAWKAVLRRLIEIARFTDDPIVLIGETGTGKELAARLIHSLDLRRSNRELIILDCTTIVPELSGSELFGHEKGSFTGAFSPRDGAFALADGGSLFLDEVGELPMNLQIQLLRVLQEHTYKRVGSNVWHKTDFRLICATNQDLKDNQASGQFRKDLYYRIAHWVIRIPTLRERVEDILPLVQHFMQQVCPDRPIPELDDKVQEYLLTREYPGNVRDLRSLVFRIMARHIGPGPITIGDIPSEERPPEQIDTLMQDFGIEQSIRRAVACGLGLREIRKLVEDTSIRIVVDNEGGNLQRAARVLNVTDRTLQKRQADQARSIELISANNAPK